MTESIFADIPERGERQIKRTLYTKIVPGYPLRIRILDSSAHGVVKHFLPKQKISVLCSGDDCPVCLHNKKLVEQNPNVPWNEIPGIYNRQSRHLVNILNRTLVKRVGENEVYYANREGKFPTMTDKGVDLTSIEPEHLNTVEILEKGPTLFRQFNVIDSSFRNESGEKIGITNFDIFLTAEGKGKNTVTTAMPATQYSDEVSVPDEEKHDVNNASIVFSKDEIWKLLDGVPTKDIFEARKASAVRESSDAALTDTAVEMEKSLEEFFED